MFSFVKKPVVVMIAALLLYVCAFYAIGVSLGGGGALTVVIPVIAAAWYFGTFWGVVAALLSVFANSALKIIFGFEWHLPLFNQGMVFVIIGAMVFIAWTIGYMRTLRLRNQQTVDDLSREIEERCNAEAEQRDVMRFSEKVIESSVDSIMVGDERGNIMTINAAALALSGYSREEIIGKSHALLTHIKPGEYHSVTGETITVDDAYQASSLALQAQLYETGRIERWEYYLARKDGHVIPVEGNIVMLRDADGGIAGSLAIIRDISSRRVIEQELAQHRDRLNEMVQAKTSQLQAREQELKATNQQLLAANEQLQDANHQLRSGEKALRESEERFRAVVQLATNEAIIIVDQQGIISFWNQGAEKIYGYSNEEILGSPVTALTPPQNREGHERMLAGMNSRDDMPGMRGTVDGMGVRKNGSFFPCELSITRWEIAGAMMYGFIVRDITARKQAEVDQLALNEQLRERNAELVSSRRALEQSELEFRRLVETMNEGLLVRDAQGCFAYVNDRLCDILGYARDELLGRSPDEFVAEDDLQILQAQLKQRRELEQNREDAYENYEISWVKRDGTVVITSVSPRPIFDGEQFQGSFAVITDITEQKKMQHQRREEREFLENIFRTTNDGIVVSDTDGKILRVNTTIEKLLGYDEMEMVGVSALGFFPQEGEFRRQGLEMAELLRREGSVQNWETEWCRKDGSRLPVEINVTFLRDRDGNVTGAVAALRDISERRVIEQHLLQAEKLKSLGEMASGVAHDFNNMLTAILGRAQLVKRMLGAALAQVDTDKAVEIEKGLAVIEDAALDGAETVRRIQDFSRAGTGQRFTEAVDLTEVIRGALEYTRARWKDDAELKGLRYTIQDTLEESVTVVGNAPELREVFTNLINNSLDAMPQGGTLSFSAVCDTRTATVTVQDTGTGIPRPVIERIFDPFFTTKGPQSTGLGMSVSYGIIRRHNGSISVSSEEGNGATLTIVLPLGRAELRAQPEIEPVSPGAALHVLVIDDDADVREVLIDMLTDAGHRVESATDGLTGLEMFRATPFDLVFTDLGMPGISGWDVAREIKSIREQTLLALVTGWDVQYQKETIEEHRIDYILNKPFQVSHIMDVVSMAQKSLNGTF